MKIAVNAGHCPGLDPGACGLYSTEADIVEKVAKIVVSDLEKVGYEVLYIQDNSLKAICDSANGFDADVFVSVHCNSGGKGQAAGTETFFADGSTLGYWLANKLQHQLLLTMKSTNRGIKPDTALFDSGLYVLRYTDMPAALCELDFIDNPAQEKYLNEHIEEMAHAIARGITDYHQELEEWD